MIVLLPCHGYYFHIIIIHTDNIVYTHNDSTGVVRKYNGEEKN